MELKLGVMTNEELAEWFGVKLTSFKNTKRKKLEELKLFADFYEEKGKVIVTEVYEPVYQKQQGKTKQMVISKIDQVWSEDGLDSCSRVGNKICELLEEEGIVRKPNTVIAYTRQGRNAHTSIECRQCESSNRHDFSLAFLPPRQYHRHLLNTQSTHQQQHHYCLSPQTSFHWGGMGETHRVAR